MSPSKIVNLAEDMIRLSGLTPYEDIDIVFTGVRKGEKLFEELEITGENLDKPTIRRFSSARSPHTRTTKSSRSSSSFATAVVDSDEIRVRQLFNEHPPRSQDR